MAYKIDLGTCIACGACEGECPVGAISQGADGFVVDEGTCIDCGSCAVGAPSEA